MAYNNLNPNGRLAIYANTNGIFYGKRVEQDLNEILRQEGEEEIKLKVPEVTNLQELDEMYSKGLFKKIFTADTIQLPEREYFVQVPTSKLMARLIYNIHTDQSIGDYLKF